MADEIDFYATPGPMTNLTGLEPVLGDTPDKPADIAATVRGLLLHPFWAGAYGVDLAPDRADEVQIRPASAIIERVVELDSRPLVEPRALLGRCEGLSSSVLYERLRELSDAGLVRQDDPDAYVLTDLGERLGAALEPLDSWARRWASITKDRGARK